jgi:dTDP-4-amino-4,6-dideoxygalactose transaminase
VSNRLEKKFAETVGFEDSVSFSFGRNGLYALLRGLGFGKGKGDEIIMPAFTCSSLSETVKMCGCKPIFVDVNETFTIDEKLVEQKISSRTRAIFVIHTYGNPARIDRIKRIARKNNVVLIEDCAHAIGSRYKNRPLGSFGDYSLFSLNKQMVNFSGGLIASNRKLGWLREERDSLDSRGLRHLRYFLKAGYYLPFRLVSSFWDARGSVLSKTIIDMLDKLFDVVGMKGEDSDMFPRFSIDSVSESISIKSLDSLKSDSRMRRRVASRLYRSLKDSDKIKGSFQLQKILPGADPILSYLALLKIRPSVRRPSGFWRPWPVRKGVYARMLSESLSILPISPFYDSSRVQNVLRNVFTATTRS